MHGLKDLCIEIPSAITFTLNQIEVKLMIWNTSALEIAIGLMHENKLRNS